MDKVQLCAVLAEHRPACTSQFELWLHGCMNETDRAYAGGLLMLWCPRWLCVMMLGHSIAVCGNQTLVVQAKYM